MLLPFMAICQPPVMEFPIEKIGRFEKVFTQADSAFNEAAKVEAIRSAKEADSICGTKEKPFFYESIYEACISSSKKQDILLSEDEAMNLYLDGYMHGQLSYFYKKDFDYDHAYYTLKKIKRELIKYKLR